MIQVEHSAQFAKARGEHSCGRSGAGDDCGCACDTSWTHTYFLIVIESVVRMTMHSFSMYDSRFSAVYQYSSVVGNTTSIE
jgi:hypothetical protein